MQTRRAFLRTIGASTCGLASIGSPLDAFGQSRRRVSIAGRPAVVVDIHAHCVIPEVSGLIPRSGLGDIGFPDWQTLGPDRIAEMDRRGIDYQALSINRYWWYAADRRTARDVVRFHDEQLAAWCGEHPDRFVALSSVALQFPDLAAEQLEHAVTVLGARGASIGGHVLGEAPSDPKYDPFWAKVQELGVPVFMHPNNAQNIVIEGSLGNRGELTNIVGNPLETTVFLTRMIFDGCLDRFPGIRVVGAHGGGYLPSYLGRTEVACEVRNNPNCLNRKRPRQYLTDQILVDSMVFSDEGLRHLVAEIGAGQVVYGTDIPFNWPDTLDLIIDSPSLTNAEKEAIVGANLIRLLRIDA
jgi:aminocarboxymuconate-semialdehyde decarboxylase